MKLRKLHIEDYKMFKDFDISFVDENDEALPIVVLAGVNGSGKTTLLEYIQRCNDHPSNIDLDYIDDIQDTDYIEVNKNNKIEKYSPNFHIESIPMSIPTRGMEYFQVSDVEDKDEDIVYLTSGSDNIEDIKETIREKYIDRAFKIDKPSEALKELQDFITNVFEGLYLTFNLSDIKYNEKEVLFKDNNGVEFDIDALSTGEKTLLSKVLYLYFEGYENKVVLIDEPELSLHPSWQNKVLKIYENFALKNNCQIIIATHSPHIIASANNEYLRFLIKEDDKIMVKQLNDSPLNRDVNTILKTLMGANYKPNELENLQLKYRNLFDEGKLETEEAKELEKKILKYESLNSAFFQGIAFDKALME